MARTPARYSPGPKYSIPSFKTLKTIQAGRAKAVRAGKSRGYGGHVPSGTGASYAIYKFSAPRAEASSKRSYKDSRGRNRWGLAHVVQRYHRKKRAAR